MSPNKTQPERQDPRAFLKAVTPAVRRQDGLTLLDFFHDVTGFPPVMWGASIIGYGRYEYRYASGREGAYLATGFSPRKAFMSIYIMPGYADFTDILARLGPHKMGKSCLNIARLETTDMDVLAELVRAGLRNLEKTWPVSPT